MRAFVAAALAAGLLAACGGDEGNGITQLAKQPGAVAADALSAQLIPSDDLPPDGTRSLFDHLIAANGQIPYPFPKLIELIRNVLANEASLGRPDYISLVDQETLPIQTLHQKFKIQW